MRVCYDFLVTAVALLAKSGAASATNALSERVPSDSVETIDMTRRFLRAFEGDEERTFNAAKVDDLIDVKKLDDALDSKAGMKTLFSGLYNADKADRVEALQRLANHKKEYQYLLAYWNGYKIRWQKRLPRPRVMRTEKNNKIFR
ncbi:hypothetical protein PHYSODRAFT_285902 [Phytophthora sojae]|uniref:RxLR effector protein n=2 Tax=Phytophthora sojae TaxID=67593 RepID=G4ZJ27_PHYSP|nr:hypothetical protein PHYSODRAFT_285902 [Phytophthora sojae]AEK81245.1 Avh359 [Phytophthora sojae]AEK81246.1 Avh359 [Phytophthora sojae]AEK81247.1 Avh359 [Phytophthora sojae]EGZ17274.1 hypothetical protein PHYSODRAFT_285902 [Phytophthora sojae]|eukprot:XP_009526332.1 hypothetical protein PHYSODRAFT_285902 [Phytophthora sojae]